MNIFISYRRDDSIVTAKLIHNELAARFDADHVFMDIDDIGYGDDFAQAIDSRIERAEVVVVVIGPRWAELLQARLRGDDWVRHEVARALQLRAGSAALRPRVIPVLVGGAAPPAVALPDDMSGLTRLSMQKFDERALNASVNALIEAIQKETFEDRVRKLVVELRGRRQAQFAGALIGIAMFLAGWIALFDFFGIDTRVATLTMELAGIGRAGEPPPWSGTVVLVGIDEQSERVVGRKFDSSWRAEHARVIQNVAAAGARTLAFDLFLDAAGPEPADTRFEQALAAARTKLPVVLAIETMNGNAPDLLSRFAAHAQWGIGCAGLKLGQARSMPLAAQRAAIPLLPESASRRDRFVVHPSLALAAFSGGGRAEPFDEIAQTVQVLLPREQRAAEVGFFAAETVVSTQPGCAAVGKGDRVALQLFDPLALPALREPPQRLAYERVVAGEATTLAMLKDKIVLVGKQFANEDVLSLGPGRERWGVELIAAQIDAMTRASAIRPLGGVAQWLLTSALGLLGAAVAFRIRSWPPLRRNAVLLIIAALFIVAGVAWYRIEQQLIGLPYGLGAMALGAWAAVRLGRKESV